MESIIKLAVLILGILVVAGLVIILVVASKRTITFNTGKIKCDLEPIKARRGKAVELPKPVAAGYDFTGWYFDAKRTERADIKTMPKKNTVLYAGWSKKKAQNPYAYGNDLGQAVSTNLQFQVGIEW